MNFLALVNRLKRKCVVPGAKLTSLTGQPEEINRLIDFINEAWMDLQVSREDWIWMRSSASCETIAGKATYSPAGDFGLTDFANWQKESFRNYVTSAGVVSEIHMEPIRYEQWRNTYQFGATREVQTRPIEFTVTPTLSIGCGPTPSGEYTITGDYFRMPSELVLPDDTPGMPPQYHMMLVYRAMMYYGATEAATEVYQEGAIEYKRFISLLGLNQLDAFETGGALA